MDFLSGRSNGSDMKTFLIWLLTLAAGLQLVVFSAYAPAAPVSEQVDLLMHLDTFDNWINVANIDLTFETYHPQGIVKIGDDFFLTATDGSRAGYIIKFQVKSFREPAALVRQVQLTDPSFTNRIHPGGIDYDAARNRIWCPLAEKFAATSASILTIDPDNLSYDNLGYIRDHLGTTIVDPENKRIRMIDYHTGMYSFQLTPGGTFPPDIHTAEKFVLPDEPIEYQDCKHLGQRYALCGGTGPHRVDLIQFDPDTNGNTATGYSIVRRFPLGTSNLTREAMTFEMLEDAGGRYVRFYFKPDDGKNTKLRIYDAYWAN
jgi:Family of unknown function (DUF6454)